VNPAKAAPAGSVQHVPPHVFEAAHARYRIRPALPSDESRLRRMLEEAAPDDIRLRFFRHVRLFPHAFVEPLTRMDDRRNFAFVAVKGGRGGPIVGSAMLVADAAGRDAEFALFVAHAETGQRLGTHLLDCLVREARGHGIATVHGLILADNDNMIDLVRRFGFTIACDLEERGCMRAVLRLAGNGAAGRNDLGQRGAPVADPC